MKKHKVTTDDGAQEIQCRECGQMRPRSDFYASKPTLCRPCRLTPERRYKQMLQDQKPRNRFSRAKAQARVRGGPGGISWELSFEDFCKFIAMPCEYCEGPLEPTGTGLDRMDSKVGYCMGNVVPCCALCNYIKQRVFTHAEMKVIGQSIKLVREARAAAGLPPPVAQAFAADPRKNEAKKAIAEYAKTLSRPTGESDDRTS